MRYKRIYIYVLDRHDKRAISVLTAATGSASDVSPVSSLVAGPREAVYFDERFNEMHRMSIFDLPVIPNSSSNPAQHVRRQMRNSHPRENQKSRIVCNPQKVPAAGLMAPADELITRLGLPFCRTKKNTGKIAAVAVAHQILHVLAHGAVKAQIVMPGQIMMKLSFVGCIAPRYDERQRQKSCQRRLDTAEGRRCRLYDRCRRSEPAFSLIESANRWKCYKTLIQQFAKKAPGREIFQLARRARPIPNLAKLFCKSKAAPLRMSVYP